MTQLIRKYIGNYKDAEKIGNYKDAEKIIGNKDITFNEFIDNVVNKYKGMTQKQLMENFNIDSTAKKS